MLKLITRAPSGLAPRVALLMQALACTFWVTSQPMGVDHPNCVSVTWDNLVCSGTFLSLDGVTSVAVSPYNAEYPKLSPPTWLERSDGHWCFGSQFYGNPKGIQVEASWNQVGWSLPYWLVFAAWAGVCYKTRIRTQFRVRDVLFAMAIAACVAAAIRNRVVMPIALLLNLATVTLLIWSACMGLLLLLRSQKPGQLKQYLADSAP